MTKISVPGTITARWNQFLSIIGYKINLYFGFYFVYSCCWHVFTSIKIKWISYWIWSTVSLALFSLSLSLLSFDLLKLEKWAWSILVAAPFALLDPQIILFTSIIQKWKIVQNTRRHRILIKKKCASLIPQWINSDDYWESQQQQSCKSSECMMIYKMI